MQALRSHRLGEVAFAVALGLLISGTLSVAISSSHDVGSPSPGTVRSFSGGSLPSWNPNVACGADLVAVRDVLGSAYPNQALIGSRYQTSSTAGGVPNKRQLLAPCTITNVTGQSISSFVEIHGVYLNPYTLNSGDCSHGFAPINGGKLYPDGKQYCDNVGDILALGTTSGRIHIEFDQDWLAKGWCGSQTIWCNNVSALEYVSLGSISLDVQGFVYWDDNHWEVHPLTAMRLSAGFTVSADPTSLETIRNYTTRANVKVLGASPDPVALSLSGCPSATVCTLSPASGSPIFASSLRVNTSAASPRGTFNLVIGATNASLSRSVTVPLTIGDRVLATFHRGDGGLFSETDDTYISSSAPNTNFGKDLTLQVDGTCDKAGIVCKSLVRFPLIVGLGDGQIPANSTVVNASLVLFIKDPGDAETLYQVTEPWTESGATWNSFATPGTPGNRGPEFQITPKPLNKFLSINITAIAQRWVNGDVNQGTLLASTLGDGTLYNSSESNAGRPTLRVEFVLPFDFSLSTSPSSGFVPVHGESVNVAVTALYTSGPSDSVQYSCTSLPTGTTCTFTPPTCSPSCTANLVLATSSSTPAGTYAMSIQATDGTITRTSAFTLTVGDPLLAYDMETLTGTGQMKDLSGHGNDGTITGTADVPGKVGQAKHFNAGDRITAPAISVPATDFTVAGWFRWTTNPTPYYSGIHGGGGSWELRVMADGRFGATFYQSIGPDVFTEIVSPLAYNDGEWHHAAAVLLSGLVRLYVDGVLVAQDSTNPISSVRPSTQTVTGHVASDFVGDIDEVLVYSRALTGAEIAAIAPPPPADGPVLRYDMETLLLDGRMKDLSGHANHGTLSGTSSVLGKVGQATHFNAGDRITAPAISVPATDFTVAAWFRWTTNPSPYYSGIHGGGGSWELRVMADGRFGATFYQSIGPDVFTEIVSPLAYNDGAWHHAAAVLRNGLVVIYVDGAIKASDATGPISSVRSSTSVQIGHVASDFGGDIDEVLVYPRALSDAEIAALVGGPTSSVQYLGAKLPFRASPSFTPSSWSPPPNVSLTVATFPSSQNSSRVVTAIAESDCSVSRKKGSSLPVDAANCHGPKTWINPTGAFSQK